MSAEIIGTFYLEVLFAILRICTCATETFDQLFMLRS